MNGINPIITELLNKRGIFGEDEITEFLSERPQKTYDPFLLMNMEAGVDLILSAARQDKKICIYGDYDADGITSICLLMRVLSHLTDKIGYYVPSRFEEGYGLNTKAIESIAASGAQMIITVDCGSVSYEETEYAKSLGLEMVITDHHNITDKISDCIVINPKQPGCVYPFKQLAGVGVAFKIAQGLKEKAGLPRSVLTESLDLVAIGTIGDIVPLVDENRTLAKYGMRELNKLSRKGLSELARAASLKEGCINSDSIAFNIVPHLNAAGRMMRADSAIELLIYEDDETVRKNVGILVESNIERKKIQEETYLRCVEIVENELIDKNCLVIFSKDIHEGIAGIVAGKIKDRYDKPAMIITPSGDMIKGTGRSPDMINLYDLLGGFEEMFVKFGGHAGACGFLMMPENLEPLINGLEKKTGEFREKGPLHAIESPDYDMELSGKDVTIELGEDIGRLAPFGNQNKKPVFRIGGVCIENVSLMGGSGKHMRFTGRSPDGGAISCVLFNKAEEYKDAVDSGRPADIYGTVEEQVWSGSKRVQFLVERVTLEEKSDDS